MIPAASIHQGPGRHGATRLTTGVRVAATRALPLAMAVTLALALAGPTLAATVIALPDDASGGPGATVVVPISATPADGILALDIRVEYDPDVLNATLVSSTPLSSGLTLTYNLVPAGRVLISIFGASPMAGSGTYYIVRAQNACGSGTYGSATTGTQRVPTAACP